MSKAPLFLSLRSQNLPQRLGQLQPRRFAVFTYEKQVRMFHVLTA